ncbi:class I SAM-dependent methyltransferase [Citrobacter werkmanii]|uniref:class I SAM-dependent methyltransferase n=1 Tax=Citrobacter werkmanii TaxID=67827 RepID=UPI0034D4A30F
MEKKTNDGIKAYTPLTLKLYDWWVLSISNNFAWRCPTKEVLLPHFLQNLCLHHLDIGVGTGYYLTHAPSECMISLMDLNADSLYAASSRARESKIQSTIKHDVFETYPESLRHKFDSISMFYLLHCLPGSMFEKEIVIENAKMALTNDGILYGATILGEGVTHNAFGNKLMAVYNQKGIFSNKNDSEKELTKILSTHFENVEISIKGTVALFTASCKK